MNADAHVSSETAFPDSAEPTQASITATLPLRSSTTTRKLLSAEEWLALRPLIEQLYIKERKTFPEVRDILRDNYNFEPTSVTFEVLEISTLTIQQKTAVCWGNFKMGVEKEYQPERASADSGRTH